MTSWETGRLNEAVLSTSENNLQYIKPLITGEDKQEHRSGRRRLSLNEPLPPVLFQLSDRLPERGSGNSLGPGACGDRGMLRSREDSSGPIIEIDGRRTPNDAAAG